MKRNILNIGLVILLLFVMCFQFLPKLAHEAMGIVLVHQLHISTPYLMLVLAGLHVGLLWQGIWHRLMSWTGWNKEATLYKAICFGGTSLVVAGGMYASFLNRVGDRLLMKHIFAT